MPNSFFKKTKLSRIERENGPPPDEQLFAMAQDKYWVVLNSSLLRKAERDSLFVSRVNAFKHALQTYGPTSEKLPDLRSNKGKALGTVFHGHVYDSVGTTYVLEWAIISAKDKTMALVGFGSHENYSFRDKPLNSKDLEVIYSRLDNVKIIARVLEKITEAKNKVVRISECDLKNTERLSCGK